MELVINELGDVVIVLIFYDAPEFGANEVVVFEVSEQLQPRRGKPNIPVTRGNKGFGDSKTREMKEFSRYILHL